MAPNVEASLSVLKRALQESLRKAEAALDAEEETTEARMQVGKELDEETSSTLEAEVTRMHSAPKIQAFFHIPWLPWCSSCTTPQEVAEVEVQAATSVSRVGEGGAKLDERLAM
ncbi:unnamed protein product [Symbiodinium sp. CCMP2592]|nr:unnamed protein product [Symbiodinium sp. CCMP2592]